MRPARILAVCVSAVLGAGLGVAAGVVLDSGYQDPLGLDAPMVNQPCQVNRALVVLESSDSGEGLGYELAANNDARYLETAHSCPTAWRQAGKPTEAYVAYLGPMSVGSACRLRMTGEHRGDQVAQLSEGETDTVQCLCYVSNQDAPTLRVGQGLTDLDIVYLHTLQEILTTLGQRPAIPTTNDFDALTESEVKAFQQVAGRPANGVVDQKTWKALQARGCKSG